jgi:hypothetical protein
VPQGSLRRRAAFRLAGAGLLLPQGQVGPQPAQRLAPQARTVLGVGLGCISALARAARGPGSTIAPDASRASSSSRSKRCRRACALSSRYTASSRRVTADTVGRSASSLLSTVSARGCLGPRAPGRRA